MMGRDLCYRPIQEAEEMNTEKNRQALGIIMTLTGAVFWGLCGSCGQFLFQYKEVTSDWLVPIRLTGAGALILLLLFIKDRENVFAMWREARGRRDILIFALIGMMLCQYGYFTTIQYSNAGTATVLQYTGPAMILVYLCIRNRRRPKIYEVVALFCSMFGTFILATHGNPSELAILPQALFWGMVAAVALVVYTLQPAYLMKKYTTLAGIPSYSAESLRNSCAYTMFAYDAKPEQVAREMGVTESQIRRYKNMNYMDTTSRAIRGLVKLKAELPSDE